MWEDIWNEVVLGDTLHEQTARVRAPFFVREVAVYGAVHITCSDVGEVQPRGKV